MTGGGEIEIGRAIRGAALERDGADRRREDTDTAELVAQIQAGEEELFTKLYERYFDRVYAYLRVLLRDSHEAEDTSQQVFMQVFEGLPGYERRRQPFRAWLFTIARNRAVDHLRRGGRVELEEHDFEERLERNGPEMQDSGEPRLGGFDWITNSELLLFIERLPIAQRQVLTLRYMLDLTHAEIAGVLGRSEVDIRTLQHRALRFLEARLSAVGQGPSVRRRSRMRIYRRQAPVLRMRRFSLSP